MDGIGLVYGESGRTFVANLTDTDWLAYTVMTEDAVYDITLQVRTYRMPSPAKMVERLASIDVYSRLTEL